MESDLVDRDDTTAGQPVVRAAAPVWAGADRSVVAAGVARARGFGPAAEWAEARQGPGTERPDELPEGDAHLSIERTFCFVDLAGFTAYTHRHGPEHAVALLGDFRRLVRNVAAKRGVRVAKWLGDGAMLVGTEPEPTSALAVDLVHRFSETDIAVRAGIATGVALLFEGDDYIGEPVNLAARLCAVADPGEVLGDVDVTALPDWVRAEPVEVDIRGIGHLVGISRLLPEL